MKPLAVEVLYCGGGHVVYARFAGGAGRPKLERWETADVAADGDDPEGYARAVAVAFEKVADKSSGKALTVICGVLPILTKTVEVPRVAASRQEQAILDEVTRAIPYNITEVVWDHAVISDDGVEQRTLLVAARKEIPEALCAALGAKGATVARIAVAPALMANACRAAAHIDSGGCLIVDASMHSTSLVFLSDEAFSLRTVPFGHGRSEGEAYMRRLAGEITRSLAAQKRAGDAIEAARIFLTGSAIIEVPGFATDFGPRLSLPTELLDMTEAVEIGANAMRGETARQMGAFAAIMGAAFSGARDALVDINLLPQAVRETSRRRARFPLLLGAAALFFAAGTLFLLNVRADKARWEDRLAELRAAAVPVRMVEADLYAALAERDVMAASIRGMENLVNGRDNWIRFLSDLQERLTEVEDVWIESMRVERSLPDPGNTAPPTPDPMARLDEPIHAPTSTLARVHLRGRMLDRANPLSRVSPEMTANVMRLIDRMAGSEFVEAVGERRFDAAQPGILQFEFTLLVDPARSL